MTFNSISYLQDLPLLILLFAIFFQSATICNRKNITSKKVYDMFQYYLIHYFNFKNAGGFMLVSLLCLIAVLAIVILAAKLKKHYKLNTQDLTPKQIRKLNHIHKVKEISLIESFYEMVFSSTSVLLFLSLYYIIDERIPQAAFYWQKYQNIILLLFLVFSVFMTNWFDILFVPLTAIPTRQRHPCGWSLPFILFWSYYISSSSTMIRTMIHWSCILSHWQSAVSCTLILHWKISKKHCRVSQEICRFWYWWEVIPPSYAGMDSTVDSCWLPMVWSLVRCWRIFLWMYRFLCWIRRGWWNYLFNLLFHFFQYKQVTNYNAHYFQNYDTSNNPSGRIMKGKIRKLFSHINFDPF